jgi:UDP-N-acetyl-D-glucosamine dehydrogenase
LGTITQNPKGAKTSESVAVVGLGYVGLPLALAFAARGFKVIGIDVSEARLRALRRAEVDLLPEDRKALRKALKEKRLMLTARYADAKGASAFLLCLPTPLKEEGKQDLSAVLKALEGIRGILADGALIVLESTVTPTTTKEIIAPLLSSWGWVPGKNIFLGYSPERVDPGNTNFPLPRIPKIVSGVTPGCLERTRLLYETIVDRVVPVSDPTVAEMAKVFENVFRAVNIGLVNELTVICDSLGISSREVLDAAGTKPFGFMKFSPGAGIGGHCIPLAPHYLTEICAAKKVFPVFTGLARTANDRMVAHLLGEIADVLRSDGKLIFGARVLIVGVTYKAGVADIRNSPGLRLLRALKAAGARVQFYDPNISKVTVDSCVLKSVTPAQWKRGQWDVAVLVTAHQEIDFRALQGRARTVLIPGMRPVTSHMQEGTEQGSRKPTESRKTVTDKEQLILKGGSK